MQAVADTLEQQASTEELRARPSVLAASAKCLHALEQLLFLHAGGAEDRATILRCIASWAGIGSEFGGFQEEHPTLMAGLLGALEAVQLETWQGASVLRDVSLAASVVRSLLQASLEADEEIEEEAARPLLAALASWPSKLSALGRPTLDEHGNSDGGGPCVDACVELAVTICAIASLLLELLVDRVREECRAAAAAPPVQPPPAARSAHLEATISILLCGVQHVLPLPAEVAIDGWLNLIHALRPLSVEPHGTRQLEERWRSELLSELTRRVVARGSLLHTREGTGEDSDDVHQWRLRCSAPLLFACSEQLSGSVWLSSFAPAVRQAVGQLETTMGHGAASGVGQGHVASALQATDWMALEAHLFAGSCTSPGCSWAGAAASLRDDVLVHLSALLNALQAAPTSHAAPAEAKPPHAPGTPAHLMTTAAVLPIVAEQTSACRAALMCTCAC